MIHWDKIYSSSTPKLLGICRRYVSDIFVAEDIVQDAFIIAMQKEHTFKGTGSLEGWLIRIVVNTAINYLNDKMKTTEINSDTMKAPDTDLQDLNSSQKSDVYASEFSREELLQVIDHLPEHHKMVFNMYVLENYSHQEIAQTLNITVNTSKSHLSRARKKVQELLFEKVNQQKIDKSKKRRVAVLLFLGFGNMLLANNFKSQFSDYKINPTQAFNPNKNLLKSSLEPLKLLSKTVNYQKIGMYVMVVFSVIIIAGFFLRTIASDNQIKEAKVPVNTKNDTEVVTLKKTDIIDTEKHQQKPPTTNAINVIKKDRKNSALKKPVEEPIVIKKQIIERDTIVIEE